MLVSLIMRVIRLCECVLTRGPATGEKGSRSGASASMRSVLARVAGTRFTTTDEFFGIMV